MSTSKKKPINTLADLAATYSKEQIDIATALNIMTATKELYKNNEVRLAELHELSMANSNNSVKMSDLHLEATRLQMRPHKIYHADVTYNPAEGKYMCRLPVMFELDEDETEQTPVVAYGETAAQACDNFDHQWVHGHRGN